MRPFPNTVFSLHRHGRRQPSPMPWRSCARPTSEMTFALTVKNGNQQLSAGVVSKPTAVILSFSSPGPGRDRGLDDGAVAAEESIAPLTPIDQRLCPSYRRTVAGTASVRQVGNLRAELTSFVGRKRELAEIRRLLSVSRIVTLTGVGGVGKTRLALRAAADQHRAYDEVWAVDLIGLTDPALVLQTVAATLGLGDRSVAGPLEGLVDFLRAKRTLLVLDNCEHLRDACAALAEYLLCAAPELRILATSRQSLGIMGERQLSIAPLPVPEPDQQLTTRALELFEGVALLIDRATTVVTGFCVDEGNQCDVARLCRQLDGIPLAIELAAVRLRALSAAQLAQRLGQRYRWLNSGRQAAVPRHQTLHALIDWSFQLLSPAEQELWTRMSIFP
jgi:hypothetical protein